MPVVLAAPLSRSQDSASGPALQCLRYGKERAMVRRRVFRLIAILITMGALLGASVAEAGNPLPPRPPRPPRSRRCHPGTVCRHGTGFCNDAGRCCDTMDGDVACGSNCCEFGTQACCGGNTCVDVLQDNNNCGGCGIVCSGGSSCQDRVCTCPQGTTDCGFACVDTQSDDNNNCGGCGIVCSGGKSCQNGACACPCGNTDCAGTCTNTNFDDANCGACGNACDSSQKCFLGTCGCSDTTQLYCNGQCLDGFTDPNNCGTCNNVCPAGQGCVGGTCQTPCGPCEELVNNVCVPKDTGDTPCCEWQGSAHYCAAGEQCAAYGCCSAGAEVCLGNGTAECCSGGLVCQAGRCCDPAPYPQCYGNACCWWLH